MTNSPRFGIWANVHGTFASLSHPEEKVDASWQRVRAQILLAEKLGFDSTLIAQHTMNPLGEDLDQLDAWTAAAAAAALTDNIEIIAAIKPSIIHPTILAKQALGIEEISRGRFAINVVNAWWKPDLERSGIGMLPHEQRYAFGTEWLKVVSQLMQGQRTTFRGDFFNIDDFVLRPANNWRQRPQIYMGGESEPARALAAQEADVLFLNAQPEASAKALIADVRSRPRPAALAPIRFGMAAFVIAAESDAAAEEILQWQWHLDAQDKARAGNMIDRFLEQTDQQSVMWKNLRDRPHIGPNGGTAAGLVGSYDTVAQRILNWNLLGIETFMLAFQPFEQGMEIFAQEVLPRVRHLEKNQ
ncbi:alkanesulfonate monooxygenase [Pantoea rodasii]|uniref:Alkanesulfonate monooxygenase n=1 Tax=Pantoea rodasii TaxID=1076549 RepID=A0A2M9W616_9GAMM|nr:LLM class flavin-dependent oxidoreductase [Pantoea rodasii]ORM65339.1 alkanesulfonate monooxygenase [Pantoea rodasii]PJZ02948.1 alkanesulfonate monooxygenase [Pantoea rodasii]